MTTVINSVRGDQPIFTERPNLMGRIGRRHRRKKVVVEFVEGGRIPF
jgi:hypothetical protein